MSSKAESKAQRAVLRCFDLAPDSTCKEVADFCGITVVACQKRIERLRNAGMLRALSSVKEEYTTLPEAFAIFAAIDARDLERGKLGVRDLVALADYIKRKALKSSAWKRIVRDNVKRDTAMRIEAVFPLSGGGNWDLLILVRAADGDFIRNTFVTMYLQRLVGVAKTNTAAVLRDRPENRKSVIEVVVSPTSISKKKPLLISSDRKTTTLTERQSNSS